MRLENQTMKLFRRYSPALCGLLLCAVACANEPAAQLVVNGLNYQAGSQVLIRITASPGVLQWQSSLLGAVGEKGTLEIPVAKEQADLLVTCPDVKRTAELVVAVWAQHVPEQSLRLRVFPPFDAAHLRRLASMAQIGVLESEGRLAAFFEKNQVAYQPLESRLSLQNFSGGVLLIDGAWLNGPGRELCPEVRAVLRQNKPVLCLYPPVDADFMPRGLTVVASAPAEATAPDAEHPLAGSAKLMTGWRAFVAPTQPEAQNSGSPINFRPIVTAGVAGLLEECWPADGGQVLLLHLPVAERLASDPTVPLLLEQCLDYLTHTAPVAWEIAVDALPPHHALHAIIRDLGLRTQSVTQVAESETGNGVLLLASRPHAEAHGHLHRWLQAGGTALVPVLDAAPGEDGKLLSDKASRGLTPAEFEHLKTDLLGEAQPAADVFFEQKCIPVIPRILEKCEFERGRIYILRLPDRETLNTPRWQRFLEILLTNLRLRLSPEPVAALKGEAHD
jgi:hypothetical protein